MARATPPTKQGPFTFTGARAKTRVQGGGAISCPRPGKIAQ